MHRILIFLVLILLTACSSQRQVQQQRGAIIQEGIASWYGPGFHGQATANGETYDQNALTAAHRTLPFDTVVRVLNLENGKNVIVRINDRGPYVGNRIIDLSYRAARDIDMIGPGTARVRVEVLRSERPINPREIERELFTVQVASYNSRREAEQFARGIQDARVREALVNRNAVYRVYVGEFTRRQDAEARLQRLRRQGLNGFVKQVQN